MGFDGTGKTTTLRLVEEELVRRGITICSVPGFEHLILGKLKKLLGAEKSQGQYDSGSRSEQSRFKILLFKFWPLFVYLECWLTFFHFKFLKRKSVVLSDRYFYDWLVSFEKLGYGSSLTRFLFLNYLPRPDLGLVFIADPEIAYRRKKEDHSDPLSEYEKQHIRYQDLAKRKKFSIIDTSQAPVERVVAQVVKLVLVD